MFNKTLLNKEDVAKMSEREVLANMLDGALFHDMDIKKRRILVFVFSCISVFYISASIVLSATVGTSWLLLFALGLFPLVLIIIVRKGTRFDKIGHKFVLYKFMKQRQMETDIDKLIGKIETKQPSKSALRKIEQARKMGIIITKKRFMTIRGLFFFLLGLALAIINFGLIWTAMTENSTSFTAAIGVIIIFGGLTVLLIAAIVDFKFGKKIKIYIAYAKNPKTFRLIGNLDKDIKHLIAYHEVSEPDSPPLATKYSQLVYI